jgi:hypothetical protein
MALSASEFRADALTESAACASSRSSHKTARRRTLEGISQYPHIAPNMASLAQPKKYTCIACRLMFDSSDAQRDHYKTDYHRFNLKRQVADLPPVSFDAFQKKMEGSSTFPFRDASASSASLHRPHLISLPPKYPFSLPIPPRSLFISFLDFSPCHHRLTSAG